MPVFDKSDALEKTGGDGQLLAEIVRFSLEDLPELFLSLRETLEKKKFQDSSLLLHKGKGTAGSIGAQELYAAFLLLERTLSEQNPEWELPFYTAMEAFEAYRRDPELVHLASLDHPV